LTGIGSATTITSTLYRDFTPMCRFRLAGAYTCTAYRMTITRSRRSGVALTFPRSVLFFFNFYAKITTKLKLRELGQRTFRSSQTDVGLVLMFYLCYLSKFYLA